MRPLFWDYRQAGCSAPLMPEGGAVTSSFERIIFRKEEGVAIITINRPEARNALDTRTFQELGEAINECRVDKQVRAVVITGVESSFSAGIDLHMLAKRNEGSAPPPRGAVDSQRVVNSIEELRKPVIASINGYAFGAGLEIALACDLRIAADEATLGDLHARIGLVPDMGGSQRLPRLIGMARAKELIFTGDTMTGKEAERIGLVNKAVPREKLQAETMALARKLAKGPTVALGLAKMALNRSTETDVRTGMQFEAQAQALCFHTSDAREGLRAFAERRTPEFKGE